MPAGLNTGLQIEHYLSRRLTFQTPFVKTGVLLGEIAPGGIMSSNPNLLVLQTFVAGAVCVLSFNRDLSAPFATCPVDVLGYPPVTMAAPEVDMVRFGQVFCGVPGADNSGGVAIAQLRILPWVA